MEVLPFTHTLPQLIPHEVLLVLKCSLVDQSHSVVCSTTGPMDEVYQVRAFPPPPSAAQSTAALQAASSVSSPSHPFSLVT